VASRHAAGFIIVFSFEHSRRNWGIVGTTIGRKSQYFVRSQGLFVIRILLHPGIMEPENRNIKTLDTLGVCETVQLLPFAKC
jgi:hypothetical protein